MSMSKISLNDTNTNTSFSGFVPRGDNNENIKYEN